MKRAHLAGCALLCYLYLWDFLARGGRARKLRACRALLKFRVKKMAKRVKLFPYEHAKGGRDMNSRILCRVMLSVALVVAFTFVFSIGASAAPAADQKKFEEYRAAIKKAHDIDIKNYKQKLKGGRADGNRVTDFDLDQLIMGIKVEREHTTDKYTALEITMDHLQEYPDYYTRLHEMEETADQEAAEEGRKK